ATGYFADQVNFRIIERALGRLQSRRDPGKGILTALALALGRIESSADAPHARGAERVIDERLLPGCASSHAAAEECFARVQDALLELRAVELGDAAADDRSADKLRITSDVRDTRFWRFVVERATELATVLDNYATAAGGVLERLQLL